MDANSAMRRVVELSGKSQRQLSTEIGRSPNFISSVLTQGRVPGTDLMAEIADACGYDLMLVRRGGGESIAIGD